MQYAQGDYTVVTIRPRDSGRATVTVADIPDALRRQFYGRTFTRQQLEEMGVRFVGDTAIVDYEGADFILNLSPEL